MAKTKYSYNDDTITDENGTHWFPSPFGAARLVKPGERNPKGTGVSIPHPNKKMRRGGWRIAILGALTVAPFVIMWVSTNIEYMRRMGLL